MSIQAFVLNITGSLSENMVLVPCAFTVMDLLSESTVITFILKVTDSITELIDIVITATLFSVSDSVSELIDIAITATLFGVSDSISENVTLLAWTAYDSFLRPAAGSANDVYLYSR
jgi:hypothetical protein